MIVLKFDILLSRHYIWYFNKLLIFPLKYHQAISTLENDVKLTGDNCKLNIVSK